MGRSGRPPWGGAHARRQRLSRAKTSRSTRAVAVAILRDIERRSGFSNRVLSEHLERGPALSGRDRGLVTHLVYGVLRHRARLDRQIDQRATKPRKIKGEVREVLRVAALELLELGHPPHAAISEAVRVGMTLDRSGRLKGLITAIASGIAREGAALDTALQDGDPLTALVERWSIPQWIASRWIAELGPDAAIARATVLAQAPRVDVRVVTSKMTRDEAATRLTADHPHATIESPEAHPEALRVHGAGDLFYGPLFDDGTIVVQGLASQVPARMLQVQPGEHVLDACAGMGGKTRQLAECLADDDDEGHGTLVAADADADRLQRLAAVFDRHHPDTDLSIAHGDVAGELPGVDDAAPFDAILLDAPCTGLGNLARHPEIRWLRTADDVFERARLQRALLRRCLSRLAPGGRLVYAVCSPEPEEGQAIVRSVLEGADAPDAPDAPWLPTLVQERRLTPEGDATEGFYIARLDRPKA